MKITLIQKTMAEMQRYVAAVDALHKDGNLNEATNSYVSGSLTGAVRRASLDLSRSLVQLRNQK